MAKRNRDDVARAWAGADAGLTGANGLIMVALVGAVIWRLLK